MKKNLSLLLAALLLTSNLMAGVQDVEPLKNTQHGALYVRVTQKANKRVSFEKCYKGYEASTCVQIGPKSSYSIKELESQRVQEKWEVAGAVAADLVAIVVLIYGGALIGGAVGAAGASGLNYGVIIGGGAGAGTGITLANILRPINPVEQTRQARALKDQILQDHTVQVKDIESFIERLELVLNKLNK